MVLCSSNRPRRRRCVSVFLPPGAAMREASAPIPRWRRDPSADDTKAVPRRALGFSSSRARVWALGLSARHPWWGRDTSADNPTAATCPWILFVSSMESDRSPAETASAEYPRGSRGVAATCPRGLSAWQPRRRRNVSPHSIAQYPRGSRGVAATCPRGLSAWQPRRRRDSSGCLRRRRWLKKMQNPKNTRESSGVDLITWERWDGESSGLG